MTLLNYSSYAHVIEKGMNRPSMIGIAKALFEFMCDHEDVVKRRITKSDIEKGHTNTRFVIRDTDAGNWYHGRKEVAEALKTGAGDTAIIVEAPKVFEKEIVNGIINPQKLEQVINAMKELVTNAENLEEELREQWLEECEMRDDGAFLAHVFLYAVTQENVIHEPVDEEIVAPRLDKEDEEELKMYQKLLAKHAKPVPDEPPIDIADKEIEYVKQLLMAYADAEHVASIDRTDLENNPKYNKYRRNFERSRWDFYSAEKIRESSKDILKLNEKDGFEVAKNEVFSGVVDVWELHDTDNGFKRMSAVMAQAASYELSENTKRRLLNWITAAEKKGICHILVGENKLWWVEDEENI